MIKIHSTLKAYLVCASFLLALIIAWLYLSPQFQNALPLLIFYIVLTFNTFFSVKLFASITPHDDVAQNITDAVLFITCVFLPFTLGSYINFMLLTLLLYITATTKYALMLGIVGHPKLLKRKILVDLSGAFASLLILAGVIFWNGFYSVWIFTIAFILANLVLFTVWPLYKGDFI